MTLLINASNLTKGGGVQVALSFINELLFIDNNITYVIVVSKEIHEQLDVNKFNPEKFKIIKLNLYKGFKAIFLNSKLLSNIEKEYKPSKVFTVFGPISWRPKAKHLVGFAIPHLIYNNSPFYEVISKSNSLKLKLKLFIQSLIFKINSDYLVTETDDASFLVSKKLGFENKVFTVSNSLNQAYLNKKNDFPKVIQGKIKLLTISAYYTHKNLNIIKDVADVLKALKVDFIFYLTIDHEIFDDVFNYYKDVVFNYGPTDVKDCYKLYNKSDVMFLPTLLECFSASYPEAMYMGTPILTSNLSFAKSVCKDSAIYFNPLDPVDIANKIVMLKSNADLYMDLVDKGKIVFSNIESANSRAKKYLHILTTEII